VVVLVCVTVAGTVVVPGFEVAVVVEVVVDVRVVVVKTDPVEVTVAVVVAAYGTM
jgi:hypothetical protein